MNRRKILAVDDSDANRYVVCRKLEEGGYEAIPAKNAAEALAQAHACHPDLVLLDVHLPDIDGYEVCRRLKADPDTADIPIVMFSAISQDGTAVTDAQQLGVLSFLFFPMSSEHLLAVVTGAIARSNSHTQGA